MKDYGSKHIGHELIKDEIYLKNVEKIGNSVENIHTINDVLSQEEHQILLNYTKNIEQWETQPWGSKLVPNSKVSEEIIEILAKIFKIAYLKCVKYYKVDINPFYKEALHLVKFDEGYSMYKHVDTLSVAKLHIATIYYINDDYDGGEINFIDHNIKIKPKSNSLVIFPGNEDYIHEVLEVKGNDRYTSTLWFSFTGSTFA
jgi:Rps23 Pro-64 3,4-dihydroxylase Tpa1-like proline 4-hydroxylase